MRKGPIQDSHSYRVACTELFACVCSSSTPIRTTTNALHTSSSIERHRRRRHNRHDSSENRRRGGGGAGGRAESITSTSSATMRHKKSNNVNSNHHHKRSTSTPNHKVSSRLLCFCHDAALIRRFRILGQTEQSEGVSTSFPFACCTMADHLHERTFIQMRPFSGLKWSMYDIIPVAIPSLLLSLRARPLVEYSHILSRLLTRHAVLSAVLGVELALSRYSWKTAKSERKHRGGRERKRRAKERETGGAAATTAVAAAAVLPLPFLSSR